MELRFGERRVDTRRVRRREDRSSIFLSASLDRSSALLSEGPRVRGNGSYHCATRDHRPPSNTSRYQGYSRPILMRSGFDASFARVSGEHRNPRDYSDDVRLHSIVGCSSHALDRSRIPRRLMLLSPDWVATYSTLADAPYAAFSVGFIIYRHARAGVAATPPKANCRDCRGGVLFALTFMIGIHRAILLLTLLFSRRGCDTVLSTADRSF